jgi:hypothetical protein
MDVDAPRSASRPRSVAFAEAAAGGAAHARDGDGDGGSGSGAVAAADKSSTLWGPEAVRALRAPRALVDAVRAAASSV